MRAPALPASLLFSILLLLQARAATAAASKEIVNDFSAYPQGSQQCLTDAANQSQCTGDTGQEMNECLCSNQGNFVYNTAQCVARQSPADLETVYDTMQNNCAGTGVTIAVSKDAFMSQARAATATTSSTTATATTSSTSSTTGTTSGTTTTQSASATATSTTANTGIPTATKIGLGVGIVFGALALGLLAWFVWAYSRRRHQRARSGSQSSTLSPSQSQSQFGPGGHDVELSPNPYNSSNSGVGPYGGPAELSSAVLGQGEGKQDWKELPAGYYDNNGGDRGGLYPGAGGLGAKEGEDKRASGVPLLAELGTPSPTMRTPPVELPASSRYDDVGLGHDRGGGRSPGYGGLN
ncbi:hypothetical protein GGR54DRAFT_178898 [Hypoxylon sp. NC1633]|nr:hypothetical protein GGR54DRAFT_178898 [Hypoxylon sp. NC1633]